ncbi:aldehyde dehydrogenase family protein [Streptomyces rubradiris]|uniref:aldehyde dehydrogenase family protein n=1 Tax=Streptomyces rubradiris TaxID=285531 RepID=UPI0033E58C5B
MYESPLVDPVGIPLSAAFAPPAEERWLDVTDVTTGQVLLRVADCGEKDVDGAVAAAAEAADRWRRLPSFARTEAMLRWADALGAHRGRLAELVARETGALRSEAAADVDRAMACVRHYAGLVGTVDGRTLNGIPGHRGHTVREPYGVVAGLAPWTSALFLFARQAAPALACGNGYVLRADPTAPLGPVLMAHLAQTAGVDAVTALTGRDTTRGHLAGHPAVGMIAFAGTVEEGREVIRASAEPVTPLTVHLATRNSAFVLADADLAVAVPCVLHSRFSHAGQNLFGTSHVYVHTSRYDAFVEAAVALVRRIRVAGPLDADAQLGPLISARARDRVEAAVAAGVADGARIRAGGRRAPGPDAGAYFEPTVVTDASPSNPLRAGQVTGPVLTLSAFEDAARAAGEADTTRPGGIAQIWGHSAPAVHDLAGRLEAGTVWINTHDALDPEIPLTPWQRGGYGASGGLEAIDEHTRTKAVVWDLTPLAERTAALKKTVARSSSGRPDHG